MRTQAGSRWLTDAVVKDVAAPNAGNRIVYDAGHKAAQGFGLRVTANGTRSFVLNYRTRTGRERRLTIGQFPAWKTIAARQEAHALRRQIDRGIDPMAEKEADRDAKSVADLCDRFVKDHSKRKNRDATSSLYQGLIDKWILPKLKHRKVVEVTFSDIDDLHHLVTREGGPYAANRVLAALSKMFNLAILWRWRTDNPARGVERNQEAKRDRFLSIDEIKALMAAVEKHADLQAANIVRLLLLTGARRGEVLSLRWEQLDLKEGVWTKPAAFTKQKRIHRVPLSAPARQLFSTLIAAREKLPADKQSDWVFPGRVNGGPREGIRGPWAEMTKAANLIGPSAVRIHDLRHTYASILASGGMSLPIIGKLLGHTQAATTHRYSHLFDDPLRAATERVGKLVSDPQTSDNVVSLIVRP